MAQRLKWHVNKKNINSKFQFHIYTSHKVMSTNIWNILLLVEVLSNVYWTQFQQMSHIYPPWKYQKTCVFRMFSGGIEVEHWLKMG